MTRTITRNDISQAVHSQVGLSLAESDKIVTQFFSCIVDGLKDSGSVKLTNFGTLQVRNKKQRLGRNPKTRKEAVISARKVVSFRASDYLKNTVSGKNDAK